MRNVVTLFFSFNVYVFMPLVVTQALLCKLNVSAANHNIIPTVTSRWHRCRSGFRYRSLIGRLSYYRHQSASVSPTSKAPPLVTMTGNHITFLVGCATVNSPSRPEMHVTHKNPYTDNENGAFIYQSLFANTLVEHAYTKYILR